MINSMTVPGFCPKLLAVRPVPHARNISASLFRLHIYYLFTMLGLSLPYRIWFAKHCDEVRVSIVKETSDPVSSEKDDSASISEAKSSWIRSKIWGSSSSISSAADERSRAQELFRKSMQSFSLYDDKPYLNVNDNLKQGREGLNTTVNSTADESALNNRFTEVNNDTADERANNVTDSNDLPLKLTTSSFQGDSPITLPGDESVTRPADKIP